MTLNFLRNKKQGNPAGKGPHVPSNNIGRYEQDQQQQIKSESQRYEEIISTLPKESAWLGEHYKIEGFWYDPLWAVGVFWAQENFQARSSDALMFAIQKRNHHCINDSTHPLVSTNPHKCVPYLELQAHEDDPVTYLNSLPSPRLLGTHVSYTSLPKSIINSGSRIVCIYREWKDVLVSLWKFINKIRSARSMLPLPLEEGFEFFCKGVSLSGPFWEYNLEYWNVSLERPNNVFFLKYEDLKKDTPFYVKKLADFMECPFPEDEKSEGVVDDIIKLCSLENLSNLEVNKTGTFHLGSQVVSKVGNDVFFRRGNVGDSKTCLTPKMIKQLDEITVAKFIKGLD
ncbi:unnamed protein product [Dovyalis caffra]|uniref:Sulfotransferase n=1 Tax=Dovyalis caffra TaxID=77055 RepID=A0AAV1SIL3_9ROSI|nr:unnamed protein product [Dovyalis caffra]